MRIPVDGAGNLAENNSMASTSDEGIVIVTGAGGHIGRAVCRLLRAAGSKILPVDVDPGPTKDLLTCDLRLKD